MTTGYIFLFLLACAVFRKLDNSKKFNYIMNNDDSYCDTKMSIRILITTFIMAIWF